MVGTLPRRTPRRRELIHLFVQLVHQGTPVGLRGQACYARCATDCCQGSCPNEFALMNKFLDAEVPDVAGHLFGRERTALAPARSPFKEAFGPHCFYCGTHLPANNPIDHVLPWSLRRAASIVVNRLVCRRGRVTRRSNGGTLASPSWISSKDGEY
jgi:hypothetical protein